MSAAESETEFWSQPPRSFKMDCKSPLASKLKADIAAKLPQFLADYSDHVLAEYIVVLVCNGKHQNQARTELQEFLGNDSGKFVIWLWNHLSEEIYLSKASVDSSNSKAKLSTNHNDIIENVHNSRPTTAAISDVQLLKNGMSEPSNFSSNLSKPIEEQENLQRWCPSGDAVLPEVDSDVTLKQRFVRHTSSGKPDYSYSGVKEYPSSGVRCSPDSQSAGEHLLQCENQVRKVARSNSSAVDCQPLIVAEAEPVSRTLRSVIAENHQPDQISTVNAVRGKQTSAAMDAVPHQNTRPRRNVWDRLGKPRSGDDGIIRENQSQHVNDILDMQNLDHNGEGLHKRRSVQVVSGTVLDRVHAAHDSYGPYGRVIPTNNTDEHAIHDLNVQTVLTLDHADNIKRKRLFSQFSSGDSSASSSGRKETPVQFKQGFPKLRGSLPITNDPSQNLHEFSSEERNPTTLIPEPARHPFKFSSRQPDPESDRIRQFQLNKRDSVNIPVKNPVQFSKTEPVMSERHIDTPETKTNHRSIQDEATTLKSRMHQVEMDVLKLRYKQANIEPKFLQNHSEEDIEPRTVLVTNVHFAASREALFQYFTANCGPVLKVIPLTDTVTAQPKGASYIVFAGKESVDKALAMSGMSFFSRKLTVMRKAEMPSGFLVPSQLGVKTSYSQPLKKASVRKPFTSGSLQWRREQPASGESSAAAPANGLGSSGTGQETNDVGHCDTI